jgi:hypothetical protein
MKHGQYEDEDENWNKESERLFREYNLAYENVVHCKEADLKQAKEDLKRARHKFFNH